MMELRGLFLMKPGRSLEKRPGGSSKMGPGESFGMGCGGISWIQTPLQIPSPPLANHLPPPFHVFSSSLSNKKPPRAPTSAPSKTRDPTVTPPLLPARGSAPSGHRFSLKMTLFRRKGAHHPPWKTRDAPAPVHRTPESLRLGETLKIIKPNHKLLLNRSQILPSPFCFTKNPGHFNNISTAGL